MTVSRLLKKEDLAAALKVSPRTLDYWISQKIIPMLKVNRLTFFEADRVLDALRKYEVPVAQNQGQAKNVEFNPGPSASVSFQPS